MTRGGRRKNAGRPPGPDGGKPVHLHLRVSPAELERYRAAAAKAGKDLSAWVRTVLGAES